MIPLTFVSPLNGSAAKQDSMAELDDQNPPSLGEILLKQGAINRSQLQNAVAVQNTTSHSIGRILVDTKVLSEKSLMNTLHTAYGCEVVDLRTAKIDPAVRELIPPAFAEKHNILPLRREGKNTLVVAMQDPSDLLVVDAIKHQVQMEIRACVAPGSEISAILKPASAGADFKRRPQRGILYKILKAAAFPIIGFVPLPLFFAGLWFIEDLDRWFSDIATNNFEKTIYVGLGWSLWAIIMFEINGLIFGRAENEVEEE